MIQRSNPDARLCNNCERNLTASNLLRSVDLCINLSQRLVFTLSHLEAHRVEAVESDGNEALRRSFVDLITDLTGAVESGDYSVWMFLSRVSCEERGDYWHFEKNREHTESVQLLTAAGATE